MPSFQSAQTKFFESVPAAGATSAPSTGNVVKLAQGTNAYYFGNAGTLAALTVWLPPGPSEGDRVQLKFRSITTALTVMDGKGVAVAGAPAASTAGQVLTFVFVGGVWVSW
jgi:hypothetical protein